VALIYLSLGSNINRRTNINCALNALHELFGELVLSPVYESDSVGFEGDSFYNLVVGIETQQSVGEVSLKLKKIEDDNGRDRSAPRFGPRSLDIDILTVDDFCGELDGIALPRDEVLLNAFVLLPLSDVAPDKVHPSTGITFAEHWKRYDQSKQRLWKIDFVWPKRRDR
jgi:2-amino-4-hydroxy-6-hydroxymethyldihydropteridine diphosphokinase